jgi:hypothetical protein
VQSMRNTDTIGSNSPQEQPARAAELTALIRGTPLLEPEGSIAGIHPTLFAAADGNRVGGGSIYYGTGLCTSKAMSVGVPFDVIGMFSVAEHLRRHLGLGRVIQLIADTHAKSNPFATEEAVAELAARVKATMLGVARSVGAGEVFTPMLSSEFDTTPEYLDVYQSITSDAHEYVRREWSDIEYLRRHDGLALKLSWTIGAKVKKVGFDERLYDQRFSQVMGKPMSFIYLLAGRTFDKDRQKVSPYISVPGERRLMLRRGEDVRGKLREAEQDFGVEKFKSTREHLQNVVAQFEREFGSVGSDLPLDEQITRIIERVSP